MIPPSKWPPDPLSGALTPRPPYSGSGAAVVAREPAQAFAPPTAPPPPASGPLTRYLLLLYVAEVDAGRDGGMLRAWLADAGVTDTRLALAATMLARVLDHVRADGLVAP